MSTERAGKSKAGASVCDNRETRPGEKTAGAARGHWRAENLLLGPGGLSTQGRD